MEEDTSIILLKGRLNGSQKNRLARLLDMLYTPSELADEIAVTRRQFYRVYIPAGCPHSRDTRGRIWINGKEFREWIQNIYKKVKVGPDQVYCHTCKKAVALVNPERQQKDCLSYFVSFCPNCGRKVARIITKGKRKND